VTRGAASPEELETLLEDAFLIHDQESLTELFAGHAVLSSAHGGPDARGRPDITRRIGGIWEQGGSYLAHAPHIVQTGPTALVLAGQAVHVVTRSGGSWRYLISWLR
jgi:hypothetical protein